MYMHVTAPDDRKHERQWFACSRLVIALFIARLFAACCTDDSDCDDGIFCNGQERCVDYICRPGEPPDCDDGIPCTVDTCSEELDRCVHVPDDSLCDDGQWCNGAETCDPTDGCLPGIPQECDDGVACTVDSCDEELDRCVYEPDDSLCDDGLFCNGAETCDPTEGCLPGAPPDCDDDIECTHDSCDEDLDECVHEPDDSLCADELFCTVNERCDAQQGCVWDERDCDDGVACTNDSCDEDLDECAHTPDDSLCDDGNECTYDICDPEAGCLNPPVPDGTPCGPPESSSICVDGECVTRMCGDGYVEPLDSIFPPEECDDGNDIDDDGCTTACRSRGFQVNTTEEGEECSPSVDTAGDGSFVIVFEDETFTSPCYTDVRFRRYDRRGNALEAGDGLLSESAEGIQAGPDVAVLPDGGFAAVWADNSSTGDLFDVKLRIFDETGISLPEVTVNEASFGSQAAPKISWLPVSGHLLVVWENRATLEGELELRRYDAAGIPLDAGERNLPTGEMVHRSEPSVAESPDGDLLAVWTGSTDGSSTAVYARLLDASAEPLSDVVEVSSPLCTQNYSPDPTWYGEAGSGLFVIAWERICPPGLYPEAAAVTLDPTGSGPVPEPVCISPDTGENFSPSVSTALTLAVPLGSAEEPAERWISFFIWAGTSISSEESDGPYDIFGMRCVVEAGALVPFDPGPVVLSTTTRFEQSGPIGAAGAAGAFALTWTDYSHEGSDASFSSVRARFLPNGWLINE